MVLNYLKLLKLFQLRPYTTVFKINFQAFAFYFRLSSFRLNLRKAIRSSLLAQLNHWLANPVNRQGWV